MKPQQGPTVGAKHPQTRLMQIRPVCYGMKLSIADVRISLIARKPSRWISSQKGRGNGISSIGRPRIVQCAASSDSEGLIQVAANPYRILGISKLASKDAILKAYDELVVRPPDMDLSTELMCSRAIVLKAVTDTLLSGLARRMYEKTGMVDIPPIDLPGLIAILLEIGDCGVAAEWGLAWLKQNPSDHCVPDVAILVASAYCDQADLLVEESLGNSLDAYRLLHQAKALMHQYRAGAEMLPDIAESIEVLAPKATLLLLSASSPDMKQEGLSLLQGVLWKDSKPVEEFPFIRMTRRQYLTEALSYLNSRQQIDLFEKKQKPGQATLRHMTQGDVYDLSMAHLAFGLQTNHLPQVKHSLQLFTKLHKRTVDTVHTRRLASDVGVSMELTVCQLLLGQVEAAEHTLGLSPSSHVGPDPAVKEFVQAHSGPEGDSLTGLYLLAQQWLNDVLTPKFSELHGRNVSMDAWFANPKVSWTLQIEERCKQFGVSKLLLLVTALYLQMVDTIAKALSRILYVVRYPLRMFGGDEPSSGSGRVQPAALKPKQPGPGPQQSNKQGLAPKSNQGVSTLAQPKPSKLHSVSGSKNNIQPINLPRAEGKAVHGPSMNSQSLSAAATATGSPTLQPISKTPEHSAFPAYAYSAEAESAVPSKSSVPQESTPAFLSPNSGSPPDRASTGSRRDGSLYLEEERSAETPLTDSAVLSGAPTNSLHITGTDLRVTPLDTHTSTTSTSPQNPHMDASGLDGQMAGSMQARAASARSQQNIPELDLADLTGGTVGEMQKLAKENERRAELAAREEQDPELVLEPPGEQRRYRRRGSLGQTNPPLLLSLQSESDMWQSPDTVDPRTRAVARLLLFSLLILAIYYIFSSFSLLNFAKWTKTSVDMVASRVVGLFQHEKLPVAVMSRPVSLLNKLGRSIF